MERSDEISIGDMKLLRNTKKTRKGPGLFPVILVFTMFLLPAAGTNAQQKTGVPCSPSATQTLETRYLPPPPSSFGGQINLSADQSKPCWPATVVPARDAPNILLIMTDDAG